MKRFVVLLLALTMIAALAACGGRTAECDFCGETKRCKSVEIMGEKVNLCSDCQDLLDSLAAPELHDPDFGKVNMG